MLTNYAKIALRSLLKNKVYSLINVVGLSIGTAFCILTFLFVRQEWTYDQFHQHADHIYRVYVQVDGPDGERVRMADYMPMALGPALEEGVPEIARTVRLAAGRSAEYKDRRVRVEYGEHKFDEKMLLVDPVFLQIFSFPLQHGDPETALSSAHSVVLSAATARRYFGDQDPVGKRLAVGPSWRGGRFEDFTVAGVFAPLPDNSSIRFDLVFPYENAPFLINREPDEWRPSCNVYVQLEEGAQPTAVEERIASVAKEHMLQPGMDEDALQFFLQPLDELHTDTGMATWIGHGLRAASDPFYSYILSGITGLVLLIACINFANLAIGRAAVRGKEIGVRKVVGASRRQLACQFGGEALLLSFASLGLGVALAEISLSLFNAVTLRNLVLDYTRLSTLFAFLCLGGAVALLAGSYPTLMLANFHPVQVLRGRLQLGGTSRFGRALVVVQFVFSVLLVISAVVMRQQMRLLHEKDLGYNQEQVVVVSTSALPEFAGLQGKLKDSYLQHSKVVAVTTVRHAIMDEIWNSAKPVKRPDGGEVGVRQFFVDYDFLETLEMQLVEGRDFSAEFGADRAGAMVVNQALVEVMGWEEPVGQTVEFTDPKSARLQKSDGIGTVIGVVRDFHFFSLHRQVQPAALLLNSSIGNESKLVLVRIRPEGVRETLAFLNQQWRQIAPDADFRFSFLDQDIERYYREEERWERIVSYAALLAVFVACLGALGLTALAVHQRTKEIGIRKVLGATVPSVVALLSGQFIRLVGLANLIAWPVVYFAMGRWLEGFAYRIELGIELFLAGGAMTLVVVLATVSAQAVKAALTNPVEALRYE